jgi:hypothetical protein
VPSRSRWSLLDQRPRFRDLHGTQSWGYDDIHQASRTTVGLRAALRPQSVASNNVAAKVVSNEVAYPVSFLGSQGYSKSKLHCLSPLHRSQC